MIQIPGQYYPIYVQQPCSVNSPSVDAVKITINNPQAQRPGFASYPQSYYTNSFGVPTSQMAVNGYQNSLTQPVAYMPTNAYYPVVSSVTGAQITDYTQAQNNLYPNYLSQNSVQQQMPQAQYAYPQNYYVTSPTTAQNQVLQSATEQYTTCDPAILNNSGYPSYSQNPSMESFQTQPLANNSKYNSSINNQYDNPSINTPYQGTNVPGMENYMSQPNANFGNQPTAGQTQSSIPGAAPIIVGNSGQNSGSENFATDPSSTQIAQPMNNLSNEQPQNNLNPNDIQNTQQQNNNAPINNNGQNSGTQSVDSNGNPINQNNNSSKSPVDNTNPQNLNNSVSNKNTEEDVIDPYKKTEKRKIVQLTDEYIMNLEKYLNSSDKSIRLSAAKEVYARFKEDDSRCDDLALNALLNKMLQDPSEEIRIFALAALDSRIATGDDFTVKLLTQMQNSTDNYGNDAADAARILLKMSGRQVEKEFEATVQNSDKKDKKED